jgi:hypothetical protein
LPKYHLTPFGCALKSTAKGHFYFKNTNIMRNLYILFFCCLAALAQAQQWQPIRVGEQYNFESCQSCPRPYNDALCLVVPNDTVPTEMCNHSIWVDSLHVTSGDSIFFLNQKLTPNTNLFLSAGVYKKTPLFAQAQCIKKNNGEYWLASPDTFIIKSQAQIHDTWAFVPDSSIWATVDTVVWDSVIGGNMDSVKYIYLSTGDTILLSQNYGFLQFPNFEGGADYKLLGIEGNRIIGTPLLGLKDFYNFDVGDVFVYQHGVAGSGESYGGTQKYIVIDKVVSSDTTIYSMKAVVGGFIFDLLVTSEAFVTNWFFSYIFADMYNPQSLISIANAKPFEIVDDFVNRPGDLLSEVNYFKVEGRDFKSTVYHFNCWNTPWGQQCEESNTFTHDTFSYQGVWYDSIWLSKGYGASIGTGDVVLEEGLGVIFATVNNFEDRGHACLIGAYKSVRGDSIGTVLSDSAVLSVAGIGKVKSFEKQVFTLAPAPAQHYFNILGMEKMQEPAQLLIYNLQGVLMQQQQVSATDNTVWINNLPTGIYAVVLQNELGRWTQKLSVLRE